MAVYKPYQSSAVIIAKLSRNDDYHHCDNVAL